MADAKRVPLRKSGAEVVRVDHPALARKGTPSPEGKGSIFDAAFGDKPHYDPHDIWAMSGIPKFPWEKVTGIKETETVDPRNPFIKKGS